MVLHLFSGVGQIKDVFSTMQGIYQAFIVFAVIVYP
jgi:hypothetical protein